MKKVLLTIFALATIATSPAFAQNVNLPNAQAAPTVVQAAPGNPIRRVRGSNTTVLQSAPAFQSGTYDNPYDPRRMQELHLNGTNE